MSSKRADAELNRREANVWEETRAPSKSPCSVFIRIRRLTNMVMDVHKETTKSGTLSHGRQGKGVLKICGVRGLGQYTTK